MASTSFTLDPALKDLLQIALGHKPRTVQANIALNNWAAEQLADKGFSSLNQAAMHCAINLLIRPEVAAEYFRFFDDRRGYKNESCLSAFYPHLLDIESLGWAALSA